MNGHAGRFLKNAGQYAESQEEVFNRELAEIKEAAEGYQEDMKAMVAHMEGLHQVATQRRKAADRTLEVIGGVYPGSLPVSGPQLARHPGPGA